MPRWSGAVLAAVMALASLGAAVAASGDDAASNTLSDGTFHDPILIEGNANFTAANGVTAGTGTIDDPYLIEGWSIDGISVPGIHIQNTSASFLVRNVSVTCPGYTYPVPDWGIQLNNVSRGRLQNVTVLGCPGGLGFQDASPVTVASSRIAYGGWGHLVSVRGSSNLTLQDNTLSMPSAYALDYYAGGGNLTLRGNTINGSVWLGAGQSSSGAPGRNVTLTANAVNGSTDIYGWWNVSLESNRIGNSLPGRGLGIHSSGDVWLRDNNLTGGFSLAGASNLTMERNRIGQQGVNLYCSEACLNYSIGPDNQVADLPLLFNTACSDLVVDGVQVGELILFDCNRVRLANLTLGRSRYSVIATRVDGLAMENLSLLTPRWGRIDLRYVGNVSVQEVHDGPEFSVDEGWAIAVSNATISDAYISQTSNFGMQDSNVSAASMYYVRNATLLRNHWTETGWLGIGVSENLTFRDNSVDAGWVYVDSSENVSLESNRFEGSGGSFTIWGTNGIRLWGNDVTAMGEVDFRYAENVTLRGNLFGPGGVLLCYNGEPCDSFDVGSDNLVAGRPLLFYRACSDMAFQDETIGELILDHCSRVVIKNTTIGAPIPQTYAGYLYYGFPEVIVGSTDGLELTNVTLQTGSLGAVFLLDARNVTFSGVRGGSRLVADFVGWPTDFQDRHVENLTISASTFGSVQLGSWFCGPFLYKGGYSGGYRPCFNVTGVRFRGDTLSGLRVGHASDVALENNTLGDMALYAGTHYRISGNAFSSMSFEKLNDLSLVNNSRGYLYASDSTKALVVGNDLDGLSLFNSTGWVIYHNQISSRYGGASDDRGPENRWDGGYPTGGNSWWSYTGVDHCRGVHQDDCSQGDGIGDTPYVIDSNSTDRYPMMVYSSCRNCTKENRPPVALITVYPTTAQVGDSVTFVATDSYDPDGHNDLLRYHWAFGDGHTSNAMVVTHRYLGIGDYTVNLTVMDSLDARGYATVHVTILPIPAAPSITLIPFTSWNGYSVPMPQGWDRWENVTLRGVTYDTVAEGTFAEVPVVLAVDSEVDSNVHQDSASLRRMVDAYIAAARASDPRAQLSGGLRFLNVSGYPAVTFMVLFADFPVFEEVAFVASEALGRYWVIALSGIDLNRDYLSFTFDRILAGFEVLLVPATPLDLEFILAIGGAAAVVVAVPAALLLRRRVQRRRDSEATKET